MVTHSRLAAVGLAALVLTAVVIAAVVYFSFRVRTRGSIKTIGLNVYADANATVGVDYIDWGIISPGGYAEVTLYFQITSNVPTNITMQTENYAPPTVEQYVSVSWDYDGLPLQPSEIQAITLRLDVSQSVTGITDFSFDIIVTAAG